MELTPGPNESEILKAQPTLRWEMVVFEVEDTLYATPRYGFEKWSKTPFPDLLGSSLDGVPVDAQNRPDSPPTFRLKDCTKREFESLLLLLYPRNLLGVEPSEKLEKEQLIGALKLSRMWNMPEVSLLCIQRLEQTGLAPEEKVLLGKRFRHEKWLLEGYTSLVRQPTASSAGGQSQSIDHLASVLGWETLARILSTSAHLRKDSLNKSPTRWLDQAQEAGFTCGYTGLVPSYTPSGVSVFHYNRYGSHTWSYSLVKGKSTPREWNLYPPGSSEVEAKVKDVFQTELGGCVADKMLK